MSLLHFIHAFRVVLFLIHVSRSFLQASLFFKLIVQAQEQAGRLCLVLLRCPTWVLTSGLSLSFFLHSVCPEILMRCVRVVVSFLY